jgi:hypothetical protein
MQAEKGGVGRCPGIACWYFFWWHALSGSVIPKLSVSNFKNINQFNSLKIKDN